MQMNRIKELRLQRGMKQSDVAKLLNCTATAISNYEVGYRDLDSETICRLCDIFGCSSDYLLGRSAIEKSALTEEEEALLIAWRRADDYARDIVETALKPFAEDTSSEKKAI